MVKEKIQSLIAEAQAKVEVLQALNAEFDVEIKDAYDKGFVDGAKSVGSDVVYTEEEFQAKLAELTAKVTELEVKVLEIPAKLEEAKKAGADEKFLEMKAKYLEAQSKEAEIETALFAEI